MKKLFELFLFHILLSASPGFLYSNPIESAPENLTDYKIINMHNTSISLLDTTGIQTMETHGTAQKVFSVYNASFVPEETKESSFKVFPNPASEKLYIRFHGWDGEKEIKILDITGRTVMQFRSADQMTEIDISKLPKGVYLIHATNKTQHVVNKIKIQ